MEFLTQGQKNEAVKKIRKTNTEKKTKEKVSKTILSESILTECSETIAKKIQKDIFRSHRNTLEQIWNIGRGLIFDKHFAELAGLKKAEMYRELRFLEKAGLINIAKFNQQNIIQLTQFSTNQFQRKSRMVSLTNMRIIRHAFACEILIQKINNTRQNNVNLDISCENFLNILGKQSNFCRSQNVDDKDLWAILDKLRKRDSYCHIVNENLIVYVLDIYNAEARRMIERLVEIFNYLYENEVSKHFFIRFHVCVVDERRRKYLDGKYSRRKFDLCLMSKHLTNRFSIKIVSYDLTQKVFSHTRIVP